MRRRGNDTGSDGLAIEMRNPNRIGPIMKELEAYWLQNPDLRLGQLITTMHRAARTTAQTENRFDLYYIEDAHLMTGLMALRKMVRSFRKTG